MHYDTDMRRFDALEMYVILEKSVVKPFTRTRKGNVEQVRSFERKGEADTKTKVESKEIVNQMSSVMKLFKQSKGMCGPASMRIALSKFGKSYTEKEIATLAKSTAAEGTFHSQIIETLKGEGVDVLTYENLSKGHAIEVLKNHVSKGDPVIVDWMKTKLGRGGNVVASEGMKPGVESAKTKKDIRKEENEHYSVVNRIDEGSIYLLDPLENKEERLPLNYFMDRWLTTSEKTNRWFIILN